MAFNIQQFRSSLNLDGARPNLFECSIGGFPITSPTVNRTGNDNLTPAEQFRFFCRAAQLPGSTVNAVPLPYFGRELKFAGNRVFSEWTVTIINDENFRIRNAFELWMNGMNSHRNNLRNPDLLSPWTYTRDGHVVQYGKTGEALKSYKFVGMFPTDITPIELDWGSNDTIEEYAVTFSYQWWESSEADTDGGTIPTYNVNVI